MELLVVEDNPKLAHEIKKGLKSNFDVSITGDGQEALYHITQNIYDVIVMDIMIPGINGVNVLKEIRRQGITTPVIMLTAKEELDDKVGAFSAGANDYLTKPFYMEELTARIFALLRTSGTISTKNIISFKDLVMDIDSNKVSIMGKEIELQNKQFNLLQFFLVNKNIILLKEQIYDRIWGMESDVNMEIVEVYVSNLRKKLNPYGYDKYIKTKRGVGYIFDGK